MLDPTEALAVDNFHGAQRADGVAGQPDFAVTAASDQTQQFVVGNFTSLYGRWIASHCALRVGMHDAFLPHGGKESTEKISHCPAWPHQFSGNSTQRRKEAKTQRGRAETKSFWTAAGSEVPRRFGSCNHGAKAVSPLRLATAVQNWSLTPNGEVRWQPD